MPIADPTASQLRNETQDINSQCKIVVYRWNIDNPVEPGESSRNVSALSSGFLSSLLPPAQPSDAELAATERLDISSQITFAEYNKDNSNAAGQFSFRLSNSPNLSGTSGDWADIIKEGMWCVIYMSQDGDLTMNPQVGPPLASSQVQEEAKKIRCIGFIDRVAPNVTVGDERGEFDVEYVIEGRDFGVVYEDTEIWHNLFQFDQTLLQSLANNELNINGNTSIDQVLQIIHDLFFNPANIDGADVNDLGSLTAISLQWLMPTELIQDVFGSLQGPVSLGSFWGELPTTNFEATTAGLAVERPTDFLSGNAWAQLKKASVPEFHELYTETTENGIPNLFFRPIPFSSGPPNQINAPTVAQNIIQYQNLPATTVKAIDCIDLNLARDNHSRYNSFLATVSTDLFNTEDNISLLEGSRFPLFLQSSIRRYGFRPMHVQIDSIIKNQAQDGAKGDRDILIEYNEVNFDYWRNLVFTYSGTAEVIGRNGIKIGQALVFDRDVPYEANRRYYIEGYNDTFEVDPENGSTFWSQSLSLTRGIDSADLAGTGRIGERDTAFDREGEFTRSGSAG